MTFASVFGVAFLVARLVVPIYLFSEAKRRYFPEPIWLWIVFGLFEPVIALIAFYFMSFFWEERKEKLAKDDQTV